MGGHERFLARRNSSKGRIRVWELVEMHRTLNPVHTLLSLFHRHCCGSVLNDNDSFVAGRRLNRDVAFKRVSVQHEGVTEAEGAICFARRNLFCIVQGTTGSTNVSPY